jgi:hypothetical protein
VINSSGGLGLQEKPNVFDIGVRAFNWIAEAKDDVGGARGWLSTRHVTNTETSDDIIT